MDWTLLITVIAMAFILEGVMPFILPQKWRELIMDLAQLPDSRIRIFGASLMIIGAIVLVLARG